MTFGDLLGNGLIAVVAGGVGGCLLYRALTSPNGHPILGLLLLLVGVVGASEFLLRLLSSKIRRTKERDESTKERDESANHASKYTKKIVGFEAERAEYEAKRAQYQANSAAYERKHREWQRQMAAWKDAVGRWNDLHYCSRCDGVFVLGDASFAPIEEIEAYLYRTPSLPAEA